MKTKPVCQLDYCGYFLHVTDADESPLEAGVWHLPGGCVDSEPPLVLRQGFRYRYVRHIGWVEEKVTIHRLPFNIKLCIQNLYQLYLKWGRDLILVSLLLYIIFGK